MLTIVSYDIEHDNRRNRVANMLKDFGIRVQRSVYECHLEDHEYEALWGRLQALIDAERDRVRVYRACAECARRVRSLGLEPYSGESTVWVL